MICVGAGAKLIRFNLGDDVCLYVAAASKSTLRSLHDQLFIFAALNCSRQTRPERRSRVNLPSKQRKGRRSETRCAPKTKRQHSACKQELGQKCAEKVSLSPTLETFRQVYVLCKQEVMSQRFEIQVPTHTL